MTSQVTGRVTSPPHERYTETILYPQFDFELKNYLHHYVSIEKVLIHAYKKMDLITQEEASELYHAISAVDREELHNKSKENLTDIALTLEKFIDQQMNKTVTRWHLDRSRNDFQACAQLMFGREKWLSLIEKMIGLSHLVLSRAEEHRDTLMPGYTHYQSAQVISVSFYLTATSEHLIVTLKKMIDTLYKINERSPLGSGAMSGQELPFDCEVMAKQLGFTSYVGHALVGVASRDWTLELAENLSFFGNNMSRFLTDLINWGSSEYQFIHFPDELSGISSSMPQKRNYPILERARGKTSHFSSYYVDILLGQRSTSYSNLVEVSKEAGKNVPHLLNEADHFLDLLFLIFEQMEFHSDVLEDRCQEDFFGGFTLANQLTITNDIPYRKSQVIAGKFITETLKQGVTPKKVSVQLLQDVCEQHGYENKLSEKELLEIFDAKSGLSKKISKGSTHPDSVQKIIFIQECELQILQKRFVEKYNEIQSGIKGLDEWIHEKGQMV